MTRRLFSLIAPFMDIEPAISSDALASAGNGALQMDEHTFRGLYGRTAPMLWAYLARATGKPDVADDLLQDAYYQFLRSRVTFESDSHRRHYLFRIASNLVRDRYRRHRRDPLPLPDETMLAAAGDLAEEAEHRTDVQRAMAKLNARERDLLWLAYGQGSTHREIAGALGLKTSSIKPLLFRARRKLGALLGLVK